MRGTNYLEQNFDFIVFLFSMATESKKPLKKTTKIKFSKTADLVLIKPYQKHLCNIIRGTHDTERNVDFIIILVAMAAENTHT